jgi:hypothetical protein
MQGLSFDYVTRFWVGLILAVVSALLSNFFMFKSALPLKSKLTGTDAITTYEKRFEGLKSLLPSHGVVGYMSGSNPEILDMFDVAYAQIQKEYRLAQYAVSPIILRPATDDVVQNLLFVIIDEYGGGFFDSQPPKKIAPPKNFILLKDFGNGLLLYRRELP